MPDDTRLDDLLLKWDDLRRRGEDPTAEDLTVDSPELTDQLRARIEAIKAMVWLDSHDGGADDRTHLTSLVTGEGRAELPDSSLSSDELVKQLSETELMSAREVNLWLDAHPEPELRADAKAMAGRLIEEGKITPYQATILLQGQTEKLLVDKYLILDSLDAGGMGVVFKAIHRPMNRVVALKMLSPHLLNSPDKVQRFRREVQVAASLTHPNIVTAYDADESKGVHFLVMEHVQGKDLKKVVDSNGPLTVDQAVDCLLQAARGLAHAHKKGVIHRDIKPSNLMLSADGAVKVLDLGLARMDEGLQLVEQELSTNLTTPDSQEPADTREHLTNAGTLMGTVAFMAPEQALDTHNVDHRADIYSLGCTLYYLLVGEAPYRGENPMQTVIGHREAPIPTLRRFRPDVPEELDAICRKMLAKKPDDRPQSMLEVITAFEALDSVAPASRRPVRPDPAMRQSAGDSDPTTILDSGQTQIRDRRSRKPWAVAGVAAVVVCFVIVGSLDDWFVPERLTIDNNQQAAVPAAAREAGERPVQEPSPPIDDPALLALPGLSDEWEWTEPEPAGPAVNGGSNNLFPRESPDGLTLLFTSNRPGGFGMTDIWMCTRAAVELPWSDPVNLGPEVNSERNESGHCLSPDGLTLVFSSDREGRHFSLWQTERASVTDPSSEPTKLEAPVASDQGDYWPSLTADGLTLAFASDRRDGSTGGTDVWIASRPSVSDPWSEPLNPGPAVNSPYTDGDPFLSADGRVLLFASRRRGDDVLDIHVSTRASVDDPWSPAVRLGAAVNNGDANGGPCLSADGTRLLFQRGANDGQGFTIMETRLLPKDSSGNTSPNFALHFDGADDYVATPVRFDVTQPLTVEAFITVPHLPETNQVALCDANLGGFGLGPRENGQWRMDIQAQGVRGIERDEVGYVRIESDEEIDYGRRTHVAAVYDGRIVRLYVDGRLQNQPRAVENVVPSTLPIVIGANPNEDVGTAENMLGTIDEVRISNVARYTTDFTPAERHDPDGHTLALYHFDEGDGDVLIDASNDDHHGEIHGATWVRVDDTTSLSQREQPFNWADDWPADAPPPALAPFDAEQARRHQAAWAAYLGVPVETVIDLGTDSEGAPVSMTMVLIPPGEFLMGSDDAEQARFRTAARGALDPTVITRIHNEGPRHLVRITRPFRMSRHEVTRGQFRRFITTSGYTTDAQRTGNGGTSLENGKWLSGADINWDNTPGIDQTDDHPVVNVTWADAAAFCEWLSAQQPGLACELPTEAQWEYACRAGTDTAWHCGNTASDLPQFAWFFGQARSTTHPVGELLPNAFALHDMHGNVWEWCKDAYAEDFYAGSPVNDPFNQDGSQRIHRGGAWSYRSPFCRSAYRYYREPGYCRIYLGFRAAAAVESPGTAGPRDAASRPPLTFSNEPLHSLRAIGGRPKCVAFSPHGSQLALASDEGRITFFELPSMRMLETIPAHEAAINVVVFSSDSQLLITGTQDGVVQVWNAETTDRHETLITEGPPILGLAVSADNSRLAACNSEGGISVWNRHALDDDPLELQHGDRAYSLSFSLDGSSLVSSSADNTVRLWDLNDPESFEVLSDGPVRADHVAFSPDGSTIAICDANGEISLWDVPTGEVRSTFKAHRGVVNWIDWSSDGTLLATAARDSTAGIWNSTTGDRLAEIEAHADWVTCVAFSADGTLLATTGRDEVLSIWSVNRERHDH